MSYKERRIGGPTNYSAAAAGYGQAKQNNGFLGLRVCSSERDGFSACDDVLIIFLRNAVHWALVISKASVPFHCPTGC
jgi:hypothetical protein